MSQTRLLPGSTIGILGAGQLARMLSHAANRLGYQTLCWSGGGDGSPVEGVTTELIDAPFTDLEARKRFLSQADRVTAEIEKIPADLLDELDAAGYLAPNARAIRVSGNRRSEREFIASIGQKQTEFRLINDSCTLDQAWEQLGKDAVAKTCFGGYDGRGQWRLKTEADLETCLSESAGHELIVEKFIPFELELSCIVARNGEGEVITYDPAENEHRHHVLSKSIVPARISPELAEQARQTAAAVATGLDYQGLLAIEFFLTADGQLLINELAPRPHNSGHHTLDACITSQFDQHIRAVCNLPLGSTRLIAPTVMVNLLSDQWPGDATAAEQGLFDDPETIFHLYRKQWNQGRRKLGHANFVAPTLDQALQQAAKFEAKLTQSDHQ